MTVHPLSGRPLKASRLILLNVPLSLIIMSAATPYLTVPPLSAPVESISHPPTPNQNDSDFPNPNSPQIPLLELDEIRAIWGTTVSFQSIVWSTVAPHQTHPVVGVLERQQNHLPWKPKKQSRKPPKDHALHQRNQSRPRHHKLIRLPKRSLNQVLKACMIDMAEVDQPSGMEWMDGEGE